jgi:hypothetical protein
LARVNTTVLHAPTGGGMLLPVRVEGWPSRIFQIGTFAAGSLNSSSEKANTSLAEVAK